MQMNKYLVFSILMFFLVYLVIGLFVEIPKNINNGLMLLASIGAVYFIVFKTDFRTNLKGHLKEKSDEREQEKTSKLKN